MRGAQSIAITVDRWRSGSVTYDMRANLLAENVVCGHHLGETEMLAEEGIRERQRPIEWCTIFNGRKRDEKLSHVAEPPIKGLGTVRL